MPTPCVQYASEQHEKAQSFPSPYPCSPNPAQCPLCNTHHILLYDGTGIQLCGNIVAGSSNNLHSTFKRSMIGLRSHKCRKERVMNVDYPIGISVYHLLGNDLHVARQHYESYLMLCQ